MNPRRRAIAHRLAALVLAPLAVACGPAPATDVLQLTEVSPRQLEVGDRFEVTAQSLPAAADIRRVSVTLRGTLARPGRAACNGPIEVTVTDPPAGATVTDLASGATRELTYAESTARTIRLDGAGRLAFVVTEELLGQLARCASAPAGAAVDVPHATVTLGGPSARGAPLGVTVRIEGLTSGHAIAGTLRGPTIELHAPPARRLELETEARRVAERTLDFLGVTLASSHPTEGGLRVGAVRAGSPADRAGIVSNDVLTRLEGATVLSLSDFRPPPGAANVTVTTLRGDVLDERVVSLEGYAPSAPMDLVAAATLLAVLAALLLVLLAPKPGVVAWAQAHLRAQARRGAAGVGLAPFATWLAATAARALGGRAGADHGALDATARAAPWLLVAAGATTVLAAPFGDALRGARLDVGVLYACVAVARLLLSSAALAPRDATRPRASPGARARAGLAAVVARTPAVAALAAVVLMAGTLQLRGVVAAQGGAPWEWYAFRSPFTLALAVLFALCALGGGPLVVRARGRVAAAVAACDWAIVFALCALGAALFLGGWQVPGVRPAEQETSAFLQMLGALIFMAKSWTCVLAALWARWAWPRLRVDALLAASWSPVAAITAAAVAATAGWIALAPRVPAVALDATSAATFAFAVCGCAWWSVRRMLPAPTDAAGALITAQPRSVRRG